MIGSVSATSDNDTVVTSNYESPLIEETNNKVVEFSQKEVDNEIISSSEKGVKSESCDGTYTSLQEKESCKLILNDDSSNLNSNFVDSKNMDTGKDLILQSKDNTILTDTVKPSGNAFSDIQKSVNIANANDIIELDGTYISSGKAITVKKSLTFNGVNGATLDGKKLSGIFYIPINGTVTFKNIRFINGVESAIYADSYDYMVDCNVKIIIDNCDFVNNYNNYYGGALYAKTATVSNSNFTGNYVKDPEESNSGLGTAEGGAISAWDLSLTNCNFIKNSAQLEGGALKVDKSLNIVNCIFKENSAKYGGALSCSIINVRDSTFESNYLKSPASGYSNLNGGAIHCSDAKIANCIFKSNSATLNGGQGGAIYGFNIYVEDSLFEKNSANYAGAILASRRIEEDTYNEGVLNIKNCVFISNNEGAIRACKAIIDYGNSIKTFKNKTLNDNLNVISLFKVSANKLSTVYYSGKTIKIKILTTPSNRPAQKLLLLIIAKSSKKKYSIPISTNSKGIATIKASKLNIGTYKILIYEAFCLPGSDPGDEKYVKVPGLLKTTTLKVTKAKTIVNAPKVKYKFKKSKYFKVIVKHKTTKKAFSALKLKLKVFTGKKFKTYLVKTNKKGLAKFNVKKLKRGKHKVKISSYDKNVLVTKTSSIRII